MACRGDIITSLRICYQGRRSDRLSLDRKCARQKRVPFASAVTNSLRRAQLGRARAFNLWHWRQTTHDGPQAMPSLVEDRDWAICFTDANGTLNFRAAPTSSASNWLSRTLPYLLIMLRT